MPTFRNRLLQLQQQARQRPDLLSANQGGPSWGSPDYRPPGQQQVATFAGRVVRPGETLRDVMQRFPQGEAEAGGQAMSFLPGVGSQLAIVAPARTLKEKMVQSLMQQHPEMWQRAVADPRTLHTRVKNKLPDYYGQFLPDTNEMVIDPRVLARQEAVTPAEIVAHETAHFLNEPRVRVIKPELAQESAEQIAALLPEKSQSRADINSYLGFINTLSAMDRELAPIGQRRAYNESLSYLVQEAVRTQDPTLKALARALNR